MMEQVQQWDTAALLYCNSLFPSSYDSFWLNVTQTTTWLPIYVALVVLLYRASDLPTFVFRLALTAVAVLLWDQGAGFFKSCIARPRPCHSIEHLRVLVHCSPYGFFSAHAANSFGLAALFSKWLSKPWTLVLLLVAALQSFSRLHLGVHYPLDLLAGMLWGVFISVSAHKLDKQWTSKRS